MGYHLNAGSVNNRLIERTCEPRILRDLYNSNIENLTRANNNNSMGSLNEPNNYNVSHSNKGKTDITWAGPSLFEDDPMADFFVSHVIASGPFSRIHAAVKKSTGEHVVLKEICRLPGFPQRDNHEYMMINRAAGNSTVKALETFINARGAQIIVLERASGGDLYSFLEESLESRSPIDASLRKSYFQQVVESVKQVHQNGIIHCDIKLENFLLQDGRVLICDFGVCGVVGEVRHCKPYGTSSYMCPELLKCNRRQNTRHILHPSVDVWSLGIVLHAFLFNDLPWDRASKSDDDYKTFLICGIDGWARTKKLSSDMKQLLTGMLNPNANERTSLEAVCEFFAQDRPWFAHEQRSKQKEQQRQQQQQPRATKRRARPGKNLPPLRMHLQDRKCQSATSDASPRSSGDFTDKMISSGEGPAGPLSIRTPDSIRLLGEEQVSSGSCPCLPSCTDKQPKPSSSQFEKLISKYSNSIENTTTTTVSPLSPMTAPLQERRVVSADRVSGKPRRSSSERRRECSSASSLPSVSSCSPPRTPGIGPPMLHAPGSPCIKRASNVKNASLSKSSPLSKSHPCIPAIANKGHPSPIHVRHRKPSSFTALTKTNK